MFKKQISLILLFGFLLFKLEAQESNNSSLTLEDDIFSILQDDSFGGIISFYQNPSLHVLVDKNSRLNKKNGLKGYRIQIYSGSGVTARDNANAASLQFKEKFEDFDTDLVYINYQSPYFRVRVGDFRNKNEAFEIYHEIVKKFPGSYIVKSKINFPKIELPEDE